MNLRTPRLPFCLTGLEIAGLFLFQYDFAYFVGEELAGSPFDAVAEEPESPEEAPAEEPVERALPRDMEIEPMEEKPEIEEFPQRKRGKPATPKRINRSSDFVDRNNF